MIRKCALSVISLVVITGMTAGCSPRVEVETYLGQEVPGLIPQIFAPNVISKPDDMEYACTFFDDIDKMDKELNPLIERLTDKLKAFSSFYKETPKD